MKKSIIIIFLLSMVSTTIYAGGGSNSCFGKWNYDKFGHASKLVRYSEPSIITGDITTDVGNYYTNECQQYVHVETKFHVRMKNWTQLVKIGTSGYAEMRATLGTAIKSCNIPYNIARMDIYYDQKKHVKSLNKSYLKATMNGIGLLNECYQAIGYAFTNDGIVLPDGYKGNISVQDAGYISTGTSIGSPTAPQYPRSINVQDIYGINLEATGIPYVRNDIPIGWMLPGYIVGDAHTVSIVPNAGAILNGKEGCIKTPKIKTSISF